MPTHAHRTLRSSDHLMVRRETDRETDRAIFGFGFGFVKPTETDGRFGEKTKNRPSHFSLSVHNTAYGSRNRKTERAYALLL